MVVRRKAIRTRPDWDAILAHVLRLGHVYERDSAGNPIPLPAEDELREAWQRMGDDLMQRYAGSGRRPWGWYRFQAPVTPPWSLDINRMGWRGGVSFRLRNVPPAYQEREFLAKHNLLTEQERAQ